ncbi:hypothetical protein VB711_06420 [Cronbergia sp. UHCC 0137]|uniref:hypothetical protein n=1 Tax=Cronbergia sp. UHCC 0137 TaxID=3110239 RepID=UPI002B215724|nr:hypothetical protein [Cronbergia sp. UHCC 0137]MEA5617472.1 hypothetical protein [Cronbergia sp. UHCC 0137]
MSLPKKTFWLSSLATVAIVSTSLPAIAQTTESAVTTTPETSPIAIPVPGTVATSSIDLTSSNTESTIQPVDPQVQQPAKIAQGNLVFGRPTRGGKSYLGIATNIGLSGNSTSLSDGNITVISKIGFGQSLSLRPAAILGSDTTFLIPITYDLSFYRLGDPVTESIPITPYLGAGAAITTGDNSETALLITGGVDLPLTNKFTANAAVNAGFFNQTDISLLVGVGYNFGGF